MSSVKGGPGMSWDEIEKRGDDVMSESTAVWAAGSGDATSLGLGAPLQGYECLTFTVLDVDDYQGW